MREKKRHERGRDVGRNVGDVDRVVGLDETGEEDFRGVGGRGRVASRGQAKSAVLDRNVSYMRATRTTACGLRGNGRDGPNET